MCARCGGGHRTDEHAAPGVHGLGVAELTALRASVLEELGHAVLAGAGPEHLQQVGAALATVDRRLARLADRDAPPSVERRMLVFAEAEPVAPRKGSRA